MKSFKDFGIRRVSIELNNNCNFRCQYCPVSIKGLKKETKILSLGYVKKVLNEIREDGTLEYTGFNLFGEPLLYPYFREVLEYAHQCNVKTRFGTNGYLFAGRIIESLIDFPPDEIVISIQNFKRDRFEQIKGVKVDYDEWLNRIANYLRAHLDANCKTRVQLSIAVNPYNNFLCNLLGLGYIDYVEIDRYNKSFREDLDAFIENFVVDRLKMDIRDQKVLGGNKKVYSYSQYYSINDKISFDIKRFIDWHKIYEYKQNKIVDCVTNHVAINASKMLLLCCVDYRGQTSIGRLSGGDIRKIIEQNYSLFTNKNNSKSKLEICRKCKGAPSKRGLLIRGVYNLAKRFARDI